jgi:hypothetical protein
VIRLSALLVAVATALLIAGVITSKLSLVYVAIALSGAAFLLLSAGTAIKWRVLFGGAGARDGLDVAGPAWATAQPAAPEPLAGKPFPAADPFPAGEPFPVGEPFPASAAWSAAVGQRPATAGKGSSAGGPAAAPAAGWGGFAPAAAPAPGKAGSDDTAEPDEALTAVVAGDAAESSSAEDDASHDGVNAEVADAESGLAGTEAAGAPTDDAAAEESRSSGPSQDAGAAVAEDAGGAEAGAEAEARHDADPTREVTVVPGVPRYHDAKCILIRFLGEDDLEKTTLAEAKQAGCTPCRACLPE